MGRVLGTFGVVLMLFMMGISGAEARENVSNWYVKDLRAEFALAPDSTMTVTEWITADCGECVGKHGIFRIVPTEARTERETIKTPTELISITDFAGQSYPYTETVNRGDATITWKIGDPDVTVTGVHQYKIVYQVRNVIRSNPASDEFYWNVNGHFWDMDINAYEASIVFPAGVTREEADLSLYSGVLGAKDNTLAEASWQGERLVIVGKRMLAPGEGITLSVSVPKGIFTPYQFGWWETYGAYLVWLLPFLVWRSAYRTWRKYGDDPSWDKVVIPEYEIPAHLNGLELGMLSTNGDWKNEFVTAGIIELAVKGALSIREEETKILFFSTKEFILEKHERPGLTLTKAEQLLLDAIFATGDSVKLSALKNKFYRVVPEIKKSVTESLATKGLLVKEGLKYRVLFLILGVLLIMASVFLLAHSYLVAAGAVCFSGLILIGFGLVMPKRTLLGTETNWKIGGLKLYMETAEKARQQFYEKERIFEVLLPAAIVFGMTKEWVAKMRELYGEAYFTGYHPTWFVASDMGGFDTESFSSHIESLSSSIASNTGTPSGSGGSGSSGGGGGGGGGGGW
jgi:uncharacterized membrane protein YgcG